MQDFWLSLGIFSGVGGQDPVGGLDPGNPVQGKHSFGRNIRLHWGPLKIDTKKGG